MKTAVAMIVFNRPVQTQRVLAAVATAAPETLHVIADGARPDRPGEAARVAEVRALFDRLDWPCHVVRHFADRNLGARRRIVSGLDAFFAAVPEGIILEDDCLPAPAFFPYAEAMLDRYRHDQPVFHVSGSYFGDDAAPPGHWFSRFPVAWGWATWADRWRFYVESPSDVPAVIQRTWPRNPLARAYWRHMYGLVERGEVDAWDYQWLFTLWRNQGLAVRPTRHLVANIGFGADATHTSEASWLGRLPLFEGPGDFRQGPAMPIADRDRDAADARRVWQVTPKTVLAQQLPFLPRLRRALLPRRGP